MTPAALRLASLAQGGRGIAALAVAISACTEAPPKDVCGTTYCLAFSGQPQTLAGIGAGQGLEVRDGLVWAFGDSATGVARAFTIDSAGVLAAAGPSIELTVGGADKVKHPTGLTSKAPFGTFMGRTVDKRGVIYRLDWEIAASTGTLDGALLHETADSAAANGTRPEFVRSGDAWLLATADYGDDRTEVRLYDPVALSGAADTMEAGVVVARFPSPPFVQSLQYWESRDVLILVQNRRAGRGWRLTFVALGPSIQVGTLQVVDVIEPALAGELEGFHFVDDTRAVMLTSARLRNAYTVTLTEK